MPRTADWLCDNRLCRWSEAALKQRRTALALLAGAIILAALQVTAQTRTGEDPSGPAPSTVPVVMTPDANPVAVGSARPAPSRRFLRLDVNGDGAITRDEAAKSASLLNHFDEIDTDRDGRLSPAELRDAWRARLEARRKALQRQQAQGGPVGAPPSGSVQTPDASTPAERP